MNLRQIETLRALMRHQNTSRAATDLGVSQPAVSTALKHMESQLGFLLFDRIGNRLVPREEAKILFRTSEPLHRLNRTVNQVIEDLRENKTGHISVMATPPLGDLYLPLAINEFLTRRSSVKVFFDVGRADEVIESVETTSADLGVALAIERTLSSTLQIIPLGGAHMVAICPIGHPLAGMEQVRPEMLRNHRFIGLSSGTRMGTLVRAAFDDAGVEHQTGIDVQYCHTACKLVRAGAGVSVVDAFSAELHRSQIEIIPFEPDIAVEACAFHLKSKPPSRVAIELLRHLQAGLGLRGAEGCQIKKPTAP